MSLAGQSVDECERLRRMQAVEVIDEFTRAKLDSLTARALALFPGALAGLLSLVGAERVWFKSQTGLDIGDLPRDVAFCSHAILNSDVTVVPDLMKDHRFARNRLVAVEGGLRFYIGAPLTGGIGTLCVIGLQPHQPTPTQIQGLVRFAMFANSQLLLCGTLRGLASSSSVAPLLA